MTHFIHDLKQCLLLLRLRQWSKAAFVFLGVLYSGSTAHLNTAILAAFAFCCAASAIYILNDICDRKADQLHPKKINRPLAANRIKLSKAVLMFVLALFLGLFLAHLVSMMLLSIIVLYIIINLLYNFSLKDIFILDVLCITSGFMLRVLAGTIGIGLPISIWLLLLSTLLSLFIALSKRKIEKKLQLTGITRKVLHQYQQPFLNYLIWCTGFACFFTYCFYVLLVHKTFYFLSSIPLVAFGLQRFIFITEQQTEEDDPSVLFMHDIFCLLSFFIFIALTLLALSAKTG